MTSKNQRLRAEEALSNARSLHALILDSSSDCTVVLDLDGNNQFVSPGGITSMEIEDVDSIIGLSWLRVWKGADHEAARSAVATARAGGVGRFQGFCPTHKGTPKWWDVVITPINGADGKPERLVSVGRDVTALRQAEQRLESTQARLSLAFGASSMLGIWDWDIFADRVFADENLARMYGISRADVDEGLPIATFMMGIHSQDRARVKDAFDKAIATRAEFEEEFRTFSFEGVERWVTGRGRCSYDPTGKADHFPGILIDITARKRAEEASTRYAERLRLALQAGELGDWELDVNAGTGTTSPRHDAIFGYDAPVTEWNYDVFLKHVHEEDRAAVDRSFRHALAYSVAWAFECRVNTKSGELRWIAARGEPSDPNPAGKVKRLLGVVADITDRKNSEARLAASEAKLQAVANSIEQMVWSTLPDGSHDFYNERWYEFTGVIPGSTDGEAWCGMFHPDDQERAWSVWRNSLATGEPYHIEYRLRHRSGQYRWVLGRAHAARDAAGNIVRWFGTCTDIQEIVEAREILARSREELEQLVHVRTRERDSAWKYSRDLQVVVGADGIIRAANDAWLAVLGWQPEEVVGRNHLSFSVEGDRVASEEALQSATRRPLDPFEHRAKHKDGSFRWLSWVAGAEGDLVYGSGRDITDDKEAALALQQTQEQLRQAQKMEAVGQLTGGLAHDFNNLLTAIGGSLQLMQSRIVQGRPAEVERYYGAAQAAVKRAAALTHRLLAFSRRQTLDPRTVDVNRLLAGMEELIRRTIGPSIDLEVVGAGGLWPTLVDAHQLENALLNLCINARDAMPDGGRITIETANKWLDVREARRRDVPTGQYLSVCVTDTGTGMSPEVQEKAFDPFFTTKPLGLGTGLGLSMIYGFARQSGGQVRIYSELGKGTTMCIYLPRYIGEAPETEPLPVAAAPHGAQRGATVLVVDDEPTVRMLVTDVLLEAGYAVLDAEDGKSGLAALRSKDRIDLLITDVGLPGGMNGRQLADAARVARPDLNVLFITGYAENAVVGNGHLEAGMAILTKPFDVESLSSKVSEMLSGRRAVELK